MPARFGCAVFEKVLHVIYLSSHNSLQQTIGRGDPFLLRNAQDSIRQALCAKALECPSNYPSARGQLDYSCTQLDCDCRSRPGHDIDRAQSTARAV